MISTPSDKKSLVAVVRSETIAAEIRAYCESAPEIVANIRVVATSLRLAPQIVNGGADIVVVEAGGAGPEDVDALERLCAAVGRGGAFIAIMDDPSADVVRRLFRAGVTDVLPTPVMNVELVAALNTALGAAAATRVDKGAAADGKIVTIVKAAGGVGATTLAANLAGRAAALAPGGAALADLDVQFGFAAASLDLAPKMTVLEAVQAGVRLDPTMLRSMLVAHSSGLKVLGAPPETVPLEAIEERFIERLYTDLRSVAALSFVELPSAWALWTGEAIGRSDLLLVVAEADVRSAAGAARVAHSLVEFGLAKLPVAAVVNKFDKTIENSERAKRIAGILRATAAHSIRLDARTAADAADRGVLFEEASPKSPASRDFDRVTRTIAEKLGVTLTEDSPPPAPLERLFGGRPGAKGKTP